MVTLLTRTQTSKTDKFVYLFALILVFSMAINVDGLSPDYVICTVAEFQPQ
jgi:exportin-2 (importin alpha re-exporter)